MLSLRLAAPVPTGPVPQLATDKKSLLIAGGVAGAILLFYMFAFPKPEGCGCEKRRVGILQKVGLA